MKWTAFGATDPGKKRANNEDALLLNDELGLYAVADGIGGSEGGEVASRIAVETLARAMPDLLREKDRTPPKAHARTDALSISALKEAVVLANSAIDLQRSQDPVLANMGTTLTTLLLRDKQAFIAHIGDSRAYLFRAGKLVQLTDDHSFVAEQVRAGTFTLEQARLSPYRHVITRALGIAKEAKADLLNHALKKDDRFLLCTDGLTEMMTDADISRVLAASSPQEAVQKLLAEANERGGVDNITAVVVWVTEV
jgi:serine/threonine protein phosphatase PrpC